MKLSERIATAEADIAHLRADTDKHSVEIVSLRKAKHAHSDTLQQHVGLLHNYDKVLGGINISINNLTDVLEEYMLQTKEHAQTLRDYKTIWKTGLWIGKGLLAVGSGSLALLVFVGGSILHWW